MSRAILRFICLQKSWQSTLVVDLVYYFASFAPEVRIKGTGTGFKVVDRKGMAASLGGFVESLFGMGAKPEPMSAEQQQQRAIKALEEIAESIVRGEDLRAADVANLLTIHLENLKRHGDAFLREVISDLERDRQREQD